MRRWLPLFLIAVLGLTVCTSRTATAQATPEAAPVAIPQTTALLVFTTHDPFWIPTSDGKVHIVYDLVMTNVFTSPATITSVEVLTTDGEILLHLEEAALLAVTRPVFGDSPTLVTPASGAIATLIDIPVSPDDLPERLTHRVTYELEPDAPDAALLSTRVVGGPETILIDRAPVVIAPPLRGNGWANVNGCCAASPHRTLRLVVNGSDIRTIQMFAGDWIKLEDGASFTGDGARNKDHFAFGEELLAVAAGRVVFVRDDLPDNPPIQSLDAQTSDEDFGNQIVLEIAPGTYAIYAHIQQASAQVEAGDLVKAGDVIGTIGNSGDSATPHLHFQISDGPDLITAVSLHYIIDTWTLEGFYSPTDGREVGAPISQPETLPLQGAIAGFAE